MRVKVGLGQESDLGRDRAGSLGLQVTILVAFALPDEPIQPIDPAAWVSHSAALTGTFPAYPGSSSMSTITSGSSLPDGEPPGPPHPASLEDHPVWCESTAPWLYLSFPVSPLSGCEGRGLSIHTDMASVTKAMAAPESGLEVRDRMWLKITIPNAFLGTAGLWAGGVGRRRRPKLGVVQAGVRQELGRRT